MVAMNIDMGKFLPGKENPMYGKGRCGEDNPMFGKTGELHPRYGKHPTEETLKKMSEVAKGKSPSLETRAKLSAASKGKKRAPFTEEHKAKIALARKNQIITEETKAKLSISLKGHWGPPCTEEHKKKLSMLASLRTGNKNPNWRGGMSFEPYCPKFNTDLKQRVKRFFEERCVLCGNTRETGKRDLHVHHVEYNKAACCDGKPVHFAALCHRCHSKTNNERARWEAMLHQIIDEIYGGRSYYTKDEWAALDATPEEGGEGER